MIPKYSHKMMWLVFKIPKYSHKTMRLVFQIQRCDWFLKAVSAEFLLVSFVCLKESTFETRKNTFYFTSKALFALEIIKL